jgi:hypothetical protein
MSDKPIEWNIKDFMEYSRLQLKSVATRNVLTQDEVTIFIKLSSFYDPIDNKQILCDALTERDTVIRELVEALECTYPNMPEAVRRHHADVISKHAAIIKLAKETE